MTRWGPFWSGAIVGGLAELSGSHGWGSLLVGAATGAVWVVAQAAGAKAHR